MENIILEQNRKFYYTKKFNDVIFNFPGTDKVLQANKLILAQASPFFDAFFFGELADKRNPVPIVDVEYGIFKSFLKFIYTKKLTQQEFMEVQKLFCVANYYEVKSLEDACEEFLTRNMTKYDLRDVSMFCDTFYLNDLKRLCQLYMSQTNKKRKAKWVSYQKDDPYPKGIFIADYDTDGWPLGVARTRTNDTEYKIGTFYAREMIACTGHWVKSEIHSENFEVLCYGNLEWVKSQNGEVLENSVVSQYCVGKTIEKNEVFIGGVEPLEKCLWIFYKSGGGARITENYYHLIDTYTENKESSCDPLYLQDIHLFMPNVKFQAPLRTHQFWKNEKFDDISFIYSGSSKPIKANKIILVQASPYFEKLLTNKDNQEISIIENAVPGFEALIKFIYTNEIPCDSLTEIDKLLVAADCYELYRLIHISEEYLMKNLKNFMLSEVIVLAEKFFMMNLCRLCKLLEKNAPQKNIKATWVKWRKGDPLPTGTFFADYDKDGWPIGIARTFSTPGTLYIKDMKLRYGTNAVAHEISNFFDILCDGNLEWVTSSNGISVPYSMNKAFPFNVGKYQIDGEMYIGKVEYNKCMYIAFRKGETEILENYLHLIDKNAEESPVGIFQNNFALFLDNFVFA